MTPGVYYLLLNRLAFCRDGEGVHVHGITAISSGCKLVSLLEQMRVNEGSSIFVKRRTPRAQSNELVVERSPYEADGNVSLSRPLRQNHTKPCANVVGV